MTTLANIGILNVIPLAVATSTTTGTEIDMQGYSPRRQWKGILDAKVVGGDTDETLDVKFQASADTVVGNYADIASASFTQVTQETTDATVLRQTIHFKMPAGKRYLRAIATHAGTTPAFDYSVMVAAEKRLT